MNSISKVTLQENSMKKTEDKQYHPLESHHGPDSECENAEQNDIDDDDFEIEVPVYHKKYLCDKLDGDQASRKKHRF